MMHDNSEISEFDLENAAAQNVSRLRYDGQDPRKELFR